jgi:hypothetical protein
VKYHFDPDALDEYIEAIRYSRRIRRELAEAFVKLVESALSHWTDHPRAYSVVDEDVRRYSAVCPS